MINSSGGNIILASALRRPERSEEVRKKEIHHVMYLFSQSARRDSNPRPRPWQGRAPPTEPLAHRLLCRLYLPDTFDIIQHELQFVNTKFEIFIQIKAVRRNQYPECETLPASGGRWQRPERSKETWSKTRRANPHERRRGNGIKL